MNEKMESMDVMRAIAFLSVALSHTGWRSFSALGYSGVQLFFMLSGYLMAYSYFNKNRIASTDVKGGFLFVVCKLRKLFPLYIVTTILMIPFLFVGADKESVGFVALKTILNICFIQEFIPLSNSSINVVGWFLSTIAFSYFVFPSFNNFMQKIGGGKVQKVFVFLVLIQFSLCFVGKILVGIPSPYFESNLTKWLIYYFPITRFIDFAIGYCLFFARKNDVLSKVTVLRLISIALMVASNAIGVYALKQTDLISNEIIRNQEKFWIYTLLFDLSSILMIYSFSLSKSVNLPLKLKRVALFIAEISPYGFLIHYVVFRYLIVIYRILLPNFYNEYVDGWLKIVIGLPVSILLSYLWEKNAKKRRVCKL